MKRLIALLCWISAVSISPILTAQTAGVIPEWEIRDAAAALEKHTAVVDGLLNQLHPEEWVAQGAPAAYVDQLKQTKQFNSYLTLAAQALGREPAKLTAALDTFLRLDHLQSLLESITAGVRRYQNAALADLLTTSLSQTSAMREKLKDYTRQLAEEREKEWEIANREAQRCRTTLSRRAPVPPAKKAAPAKP